MDMIVSCANNTLSFGERTIRCAIGKAGATATKIEGDHATPYGRYALRELLFRPDRLAIPSCTLHITAITPSMGWCDDSADAQYNKRVTLPYDASHETLWRDDCRYDMIIPLGYNDAPPVPGKGSAIFFHLTDDYSGTEGCVAIARTDMLELLTSLNNKTYMKII